MPGIFISYRQDDSKAWALMLRKELVEVFGEERVFLDKDTLYAGNWRSQINKALDQCRVVLVLIGRRWLDLADESGQRRLNRADDVHRQEIALALSRKEITVIPVRVDGVSMPHAEDLPESIRSLTDQQSRELSDGSARREVDLRVLIEDIERVTGLKRKPKQQTSPRDGRTAFDDGRAGLGRTVKVLLITLIASVSLLVAAEVGLGWTFDPSEIAFLVLVVLGVTLMGSKLRGRVREKGEDAKS